MARLEISTYEKAIRIKEQRGEVVHLKREFSFRIDSSISRSFGKNKFKGYDKKQEKRPHTGYCPVKRTSKPPKRKKVHDFESKGQSERVNLTGMDLEKDSLRQKNLLFFLFLIAGLLLLFFDIKDKGMTLEFVGFQYYGSLVGTLVCGVSGFGIIRNKPKVKIENQVNRSAYKNYRACLK